MHGSREMSLVGREWLRVEVDTLFDPAVYMCVSMYLYVMVVQSSVERQKCTVSSIEIPRLSTVVMPDFCLHVYALLSRYRERDVCNVSDGSFFDRKIPLLLSPLRSHLQTFPHPLYILTAVKRTDEMTLASHSYTYVELSVDVLLGISAELFSALSISIHPFNSLSFSFSHGA